MRYFWYSLMVFAINFGIIGVAVYRGRVLHQFDYSPDVAPTWLDYTGAVIVTLLPAALFGLLAGVAASVRRGRRAERTYFAWAALIGGLTVYCIHWLTTWSPMGCADSSVASVPTYAALRWVALAAAIPAVLMPLVLAVFARQRD